MCFSVFINHKLQSLNYSPHLLINNFVARQLFSYINYKHR